MKLKRNGNRIILKFKFRFESKQNTMKLTHFHSNCLPQSPPPLQYSRNRRRCHSHSRQHGLNETLNASIIQLQLRFETNNT